MNMETILTYLSDLELHNDREWYHANKDQLHTANIEFETLISDLISEIQITDAEIPYINPKELTFKLVRDTRFSHDKSPYNPAFRAHIASKGKLPVPVGYYVMIKPGGHSFLGGGLFADMFKDATSMVRDYIVSHGNKWEEIISSPSFTKLFTVKGSTLKKVPQGYDTGHPQAESLKNKSWYLEYIISDKQLLDHDFIHFAANVFAQMQPFNHYLNQALHGFIMPKR